MGLLNFLWPFEKKFSEIPGAREAGVAGMLGGLGTGASTIIIFNHPRYAYRTSLFSGFVIFWVTFIVCRVQQNTAKKASRHFLEAYKSGDFDD